MIGTYFKMNFSLKLQIKKNKNTLAITFTFEYFTSKNVSDLKALNHIKLYIKKIFVKRNQANLFTLFALCIHIKLNIVYYVL